MLPSGSCSDPTELDYVHYQQEEGELVGATGEAWLGLKAETGHANVGSREEPLPHIVYKKQNNSQ